MQAQGRQEEGATDDWIPAWGEYYQSYRVDTACAVGGRHKNASGKSRPAVERQSS